MRKRANFRLDVVHTSSSLKLSRNNWTLSKGDKEVSPDGLGIWYPELVVVLSLGLGVGSVIVVEVLLYKSGG